METARFAEGNYHISYSNTFLSSILTMASRGKDVSGLVQTLTDETSWNSVLDMSEDKLVSEYRFSVLFLYNSHPQS